MKFGDAFLLLNRCGSNGRKQLVGSKIAGIVSYLAQTHYKRTLSLKWRTIWKYPPPPHTHS